MLQKSTLFDNRIDARSRTGRFRAETRSFGERSRVATKSKLEQAVEKQAEGLNDVQRRLVMSQFSDFKRNKARIAEIDDKIGALDVQMLANPEQEKLRLAQRSTLVSERSHLVEANNGIAANLFDQLGEKEQ